MAVCRKCNKGANEIGGYLERVNELGVDGIYECRPSCDVNLSYDEKILMSIEGDINEAENN